MNIKNNIINYLYDKDYIVCMYENFLYVFNYKYLDSFDEKRVVVVLNDRIISVIGTELLIGKMTKEEILIRGKIDKIEVKHNA